MKLSEKLRASLTRNDGSNLESSVILFLLNQFACRHCWATRAARSSLKLHCRSVVQQSVAVFN